MTDGTVDPTVIGVGTYFKNTAVCGHGHRPPTSRGARPLSVLRGSARRSHQRLLHHHRARPVRVVVPGSRAPIRSTCTTSSAARCRTTASASLVSGPRWRLKANKFGQDIPGLEIPLIECSPPPFTKENIKYNVGEPVTTVINLLDWEDENGPLATSKGWVDLTVVPDPDVAGRCRLASNPNVTIINVIDEDPAPSRAHAHHLQRPADDRGLRPCRLREGRS